MAIARTGARLAGMCSGSNEVDACSTVSKAGVIRSGVM